MTQKGCSPKNLIKDMVKVEHHAFRERTLCTSLTYRADIAQAMVEFAALPTLNFHDLIDLRIRGIRSAGFEGFFYQPEPLGPECGTGSNHRGDAGLFNAAHRRYLDGGWNAGKEEV